VSGGGGGSGDVVGPASAVSGNIVTFDGVTGKLIADGGISSSTFAPASKGVTNGDSHDHAGGDGAQISYANLSNIPSTFAPSSHHASHESGGSDAIKLDNLDTPDDNTDLNATTGYHGLLPKLSGTGTDFLAGDGTWKTAGGGGVSAWVVKTGAYTAVTGDRINMDSSGGIFTITLPASPSAGDEIDFNDVTKSCGTYNVTIGRNGNNIDSTAEDLVVDTNGACFKLIYFDASVGWDVAFITAG